MISRSALFLDRDGVINARLDDDYVKNVDEFHFIPGVIEGIAKLSGVFGRIFVVTNQQGVGKGLMSKEALHEIHDYMIRNIEKGGGRIDRIYYCGDLAQSGSRFRKPAIGMGLQAKKDFPEISFKHSVMIGDTLTDMIFGRRLKMKTILINQDLILSRKHPQFIDMRYDTLIDFANSASQ